MQVTEQHFNQILKELIDENPLACQAVLSILDVVFTEDVDTLSVSLSDRPRLMVNLNFLNQNAETETDVKAVLLHEFLHILLNHTEQYTRMDTVTNIALDSVINAIIHRSLGTEYSAFMTRYYADAKGISGILRPPRKDGYNLTDSTDVQRLWWDIYEGRLVVDDILDAARALEEFVSPKSIFQLLKGKFLIGGHDKWDGKKLSDEAYKALERALSEMNGDGIWRSPKGRGIGANPYDAFFVQKNEKMTRWERTTWHVLMKLLTPDRNAPQREWIDRESVLPILTERDKRSFLKTFWSPIIPDAVWQTAIPQRASSAQVYLDVSGSMNAEMQALVALLTRMRRFIRMPFWAFSDEVKPAIIEKGILKTQTSGGTSINSVLKHVADTGPGKALIITDGYIEECDKNLLRHIAGQAIHVLLSRDGSPAEIQRAGIPYTQLEKYPT